MHDVITLSDATAYDNSFEQLFGLFIHVCKYLTRYLWMIPCVAISMNRLPNQRSGIETKRQRSVSELF